MQLVSSGLLLLLLREGLLQSTDLLLVLGGRVPPVLQLCAHTAQVGLQGSNLSLPLRCGCLHGVPQDEDLTEKSEESQGRENQLQSEKVRVTGESEWEFGEIEWSHRVKGSQEE